MTSEGRRVVSRRKLLAVAGVGLGSLSGCTKAGKILRKSDDLVRRGDDVVDAGSDIARKGDDPAEVVGKGDEAAESKTGLKDGVEAGSDGVEIILDHTESTTIRTTTTEVDPSSATRTDLVPPIATARTVESGHYRYWGLPLADRADSRVNAVEVSYAVSVISGPAVDVILLPVAEYDNFRNWREYRYYPEGSEFDTRFTTKTGVLSPTNVYLLVDNSDLGTTTEGGDARIKLDLTATF